MFAAETPQEAGRAHARLSSVALTMEYRVIVKETVTKMVFVEAPNGA